MKKAVQRKKVPVKKIVSYFFFFLAFIVLFISIYLGLSFQGITFEEVLYTITSVEGTGVDSLGQGFFFVAIPVLIIMILIIVVTELIERKRTYDLVIKTNKRKIKVLPLSNNGKLVISAIFFIVTCCIFLGSLDVSAYVESLTVSTNLYEDYYVDPSTVNITFPKKKKNLIFIYLESMEMTAASKENGGYQEDSLIPNLEKLALGNTNFSNTSRLGGALDSVGSTWTAASIIGHTSGVPLKIPLIIKNQYGLSGESMPGAYSLGEILEKNGYHNYFFIGSRGEFGGRSNYLTKHGNYTIYDYNYARKQKWIPNNYYVWWGYEDSKLFELAKKELLEIAKKDEPFNFTTLTTNTHFVDGYLEKSCEKKFDSKYANAIYCSDSQVYEFVRWIQRQDFYKDTVVILVGDHLTMQSDFYKNEGRSIYNTIINSDLIASNEKERTFTIVDMYPTTLAALGAKIDGDRLALGTNLYSSKKTIPEEMGYEEYNKKLNQKSDFYINNILGSTYDSKIQELEEIEEEEETKEEAKEETKKGIK